MLKYYKWLSWKHWARVCQALNLPVALVSRQLPAKSSELLLTWNPLTDGRFKLGQSCVASVLLLNPSPADPARAVQETQRESTLSLQDRSGEDMLKRSRFDLYCHSRAKSECRQPKAWYIFYFSHLAVLSIFRGPRKWCPFRFVRSSGRIPLRQPVPCIKWEDVQETIDSAGRWVFSLIHPHEPVVELPAPVLGMGQSPSTRI